MSNNLESLVNNYNTLIFIENEDCKSDNNNNNFKKNKNNIDNISPEVLKHLKRKKI